jgi:hypothetical protein
VERGYKKLNDPTNIYWGIFIQIEIISNITNHCVVMAQLYTQGKCHGIHTFMVQIRSMEDHSVMPGELSPSNNKLPPFV